VRRRSRFPSSRPAVVALVALLLLTVVPSASTRAASYPPLPIPLDRQFLGNLSAPSISPGGSTRLSFAVTDPASLSAPLTSVVLTFEVYAFNGFPGDASAQLPVGNAPVLSNSSGSGSTVNVTIPSLASGSTSSGSVGISTSSDTPAGTFAIRTALSFHLNGTPYLLESRGWFSAATWSAATEAPNGTATLNLSVLGVSGVIPETAVLVSSSDWTWALAALLAGAFVLLAAGAWVYSRRGPGSTAGTG
jgi:hypothetical protein